MEVESSFVFQDQIQHLSGALECPYLPIRWSLEYSSSPRKYLLASVFN